jgi:hypothetical protein
MRKIILTIVALMMFIMAGCSQKTLESKLRDEIKEMGYEIIEYDDDVLP